MTSAVHIVEVGPRDGLQNEKNNISTQQKIAFIENLQKAGLKHIELTACVHPKAVPQMADAPEILNHFKSPGFQAYCLVPNQKGYERLTSFQAPAVAVVVGTTDSFNEKNIGMTTKQALEECSTVVKSAANQKRPVRAYISTAFGCPYEGKVNVKQFMHVFEAFQKMGVSHFSLGDTIGIASPHQVREYVDTIKGLVPTLAHVAFHMHDTFGRGLLNCFVALDKGIRWFDGSAGGLGGCPYAKGASGNIATEDLISAFESEGLKIEGNPHISQISTAVGQLVSSLGHVPPGHLFQQWFRKHQAEPKPGV